MKRRLARRFRPSQPEAAPASAAAGDAEVAGGSPGAPERPAEPAYEAPPAPDSGAAPKAAPPAAPHAAPVEPPPEPPAAASGPAPASPTPAGEARPPRPHPLSATGAVAGRELRALLFSPAGWLVAALVVVPVSALGYLGAAASGTAGLTTIFGVLSFLMLLYVPALTMRVFAEERRAGTLELLLSHPVGDAEVVIGKWLGVYLFFLLTIAFTLVYVVLLAAFLPKQALSVGPVTLSVGAVDWGVLVAGYCGVLLAGAAMSAIGVLLSSLTTSPVVAVVAGWVTILLIWYLGGFLGLLVAPPFNQPLAYVGAANRFEPFTRGLLELSDVVYFLSIAVTALILTVRVLDARHWRP